MRIILTTARVVSHIAEPLDFSSAHRALNLHLTDKYAYRIPKPKHTPKYTKAKVLCTQDKHTQLSSFAELHCCPIKSLAATSLPEYADTQSLLTGYLRPSELNMTLSRSQQHNLKTATFTGAPQHNRQFKHLTQTQTLITLEFSFLYLLEVPLA